ncbi:hypothetical protein MMG85_03315 [Pseudoxanthomonas sp. LH2527]|uniref:hypothetical protein n=1 Tax=Pseudoxanthomonas sp. LH2527 TaxID=2923249 RepID=UPI001F1375F8|nr:hypothetical protein [Pseudoxanthomonas sp. LH2527]MCH6482602.1 hypothetical protein [Pseudoxanthomonas sp. LH2527]
MRPTVARPLLAACLAIAAPAWGADPKPEIARPAAAPQAVGAVHTLRQIPEACARLEGAFTGDAVQPYRYAPVRTSPQCQPRARFVDFDKAKPSVAAGWKLNDVIRVPNAACPSQQAVVRVWRKPGSAAPPPLDGQGQSRIYLQDAKQQAGAAAQAPSLTVFAAKLDVEGKACK